jgi:hypothetical protein
MSRLIREDLNFTKEFISEYSLKSCIDNHEYVRILSQNHKKYFAFLLFLSELENTGFKSIKISLKLNNENYYNFRNYLKECVSDLGCAFFNWIQGDYKSSRLLIRSSVEDFVKSMASVEDNGICEIKSVYEVFERASTLDIFSSEINAGILTNLKNTYSILCRDVHTANYDNMQQISAMEYFPAFEAEKANQTSKYFIEVSKEMLSLLSLSFKDVYVKMHPGNLDIINPVLIKVVKHEIYAPSET